MERPLYRDLAIRVVLVAVALGLVLLVFASQIEQAIGVAACMERAKYELILCAAPPDAWKMLLTAGLAVALAILLGVLLGTVRRRTSNYVDVERRASDIQQP